MVARKLTSRHLTVHPETSVPQSARVRGSLGSPKRPDHGHRHSKLVAAFVVAFTALCVVFTYMVLHSLLSPVDYSSPLGNEEDPAQAAMFKKTLAFDVCNGMTNQRLALLYGIIMAFELGRTAILPDFLLSGVQWSDMNTIASNNNNNNNNSVPMSQLYNVQYFIQTMAAIGVDVMDPRYAPPRELYTFVDITKVQDPVEDLAAKYRSTNHLAVGCPLFKLQSYYFSGANTHVMWSVIDGLKPAKQIASKVNAVVRKLRSATPHHTFNYLHLRMEEDWVLHCQRWTHIPDGRIRDNCMNNTDKLDWVLSNLNVPVTEPLYVATFWEQVEPELLERAMGKLTSAGYQVFTSKDFKVQQSHDRELNALTDYEVALHAHKFIGNSVSTFSALALFQRRHHGLWSSYYNGGNIPIAEFLPMDMLPWVFTYTSYTPEQDYLVMAAVKSAMRFRTMQPFCIYSGNTSAPIYEWLKEHGVMLISHDPSWEHALWSKAQPLAEVNAVISPIYSSRDMLINDFIRMDLPLLKELEEHVYVLFTEPDVFFYKKVSLMSFGLPLPNIISFPADRHAAMGIDGGVMLVNMLKIRETYEEFKLFVLGNHRGGLFSQEAPGVKGAYAQFYERELRKLRLAEHFAVKPTQAYNPGAHIVHFKGPRPHEYWHYFHTLNCSYQGLCEQGFRQGLCSYVKRWHPLLNETSTQELGLSLWYACQLLYAPHLKEVCSRQAEL